MVGACIYGWHGGGFGDIHSWFAGDLIRLAYASRIIAKGSAKRDGGFTWHVPSTPRETRAGRVCAFAGRNYRARRFLWRHADEPGARRPADGAHRASPGAGTAAAAARSGADLRGAPARP